MALSFVQAGAVELKSTAYSLELSAVAFEFLMRAVYLRSIHEARPVRLAQIVRTVLNDPEMLDDGAIAQFEGIRPITGHHKAHLALTDDDARTLHDLKTSLCAKITPPCGAREVIVLGAVAITRLDTGFLLKG